MKYQNLFSGKKIMIKIFQNFICQNFYPVCKALTPYHTCPKMYRLPFYSLFLCIKMTGQVTNSDPDQMPFLLSSVCLHTFVDR